MFTLYNRARYFLLFTLSALAAGFFYTVQSAGAAPLVRQVLDPKLSRVTVKLDSPLVQFEALATNVTGYLDLDTKDVTNSKVHLSADLKNLRIQRSNSPIDLEQIFSSLSGPEITFGSTSISRIQQNQYRVVGVVKRGSQTWPAQVTVQYTSSPDRSLVVAEREGVIKNNVPDSPIPIAPGESSGAFKCSLVFRTAAPATSLFQEKF